LDSATAAFVAHLASLGFERGDRVAIFINIKPHPREAAFIVENAKAV
jgi:hypothetical protein